MTKEKTTVWLVNESGHDYSEAEQYGDIRAITVHQVDPFNLDRLMWHISLVISKMTHRDDYILISGTPILSGLVMTMWLKIHDQCKILQWHARERIYLESLVTREQVDNLLQRQLESR